MLETIFWYVAAFAIVNLLCVAFIASLHIVSAVIYAIRKATGTLPKL